MRSCLERAIGTYAPNRRFPHGPGHGGAGRPLLRRSLAVPERRRFPLMRAFDKRFRTRRPDSIDESAHEREPPRRFREGGGRGRGSRRFSTEKRPRTVPSEGVSRELFPRCLRDLGEWGTGGRRGGRGRRPEAFSRRKPPRDRVPRADGETAGACRIGRGGNLGPPGEALGRVLCVKGGIGTNVSRETFARGWVGGAGVGAAGLGRQRPPAVAGRRARRGAIAGISRYRGGLPASR